MDFSVDFFKDEVRNGFYIPTAVKQAWAANLCVLSEIDRICEKYCITYFADWGTMLGAVRHGGYVPWDDDLDICMKREDYGRFREIADRELPGDFAIHDFRRKDNHRLFLTRVVNCNHICFEEEHLKEYYNFPYISVVDIFIEDYLYRDKEKENERCKEIKKLIAVADGIVDGSFSKDTIARELSDIERHYDVVINRKGTVREIGITLYEIAEQQMARVDEADSDRIGQMFPFVLKGYRGMPKEYYDKAVRIPFENTTIPVPACYNEMLRSRYGNYLEIHKIWGGHNYPYFEGQKANLQAVADFALPEFTFKQEMLAPCDRKESKADSLAGLSKGIINQLADYNKQISLLCSEGNYNDLLELMPEIQQFAVDFGTLVEEVKGQERNAAIEVVSAIQGYCDVLYQLFLFINGDSGEGFAIDKVLKELDISFDQLEYTVGKNVINRKEVLFLTIGPKEWKGFEEIYKEIESAGDCDIYIVPIPIFFKDIYGRVQASEKEILTAIDYEEYPNDLTLNMWTEYNIELHRPDVIYIQNPYDGENPCLTVPPQFYAANIRKYTDKLIYIQPFVTGEFGKEDYNDVYNMKHYVTAPGVIYADEIFVQSDNIKKRYIDKLVEFAGVDTKNIWERKVKTAWLKKDAAAPEPKYNRKKILYCIGLNEISEHIENIIEKIRDRMNVFESNKESIAVDVILFPGNMEEWNNIGKAVTHAIRNLINEYSVFNWSELIDYGSRDYESLTADYDAYYGSASPFVPIFSGSKKPVMISNYDI